jgi:hypothetical protein
MSAIAATGLSSSAIVSLLNSGLSSPPQAVPVTTQSGASPSSNPIDSLNLSDHAKAILAQAQQEQVAANELQSFLQSARNSNGNGNSSASNQTSGNNVLQNFDQLTGQTQAPTQTQAQQSGTQTQSFNNFFDAQVAALKAANTGPDGTIKNFSETFNDISFAPTTPEAINNWYQNFGQAAVQGAPQIAQQAPGSPQAINAASLAQAVENHTVTLLNASDIPGLDFHNSLTIQGGENGAENSWSVTYNHDAAIFNDPTTNYEIGDDGTVISWKNPAPSDAASS